MRLKGFNQSTSDDAKLLNNMYTGVIYAKPGYVSDWDIEFENGEFGIPEVDAETGKMLKDEEDYFLSLRHKTKLEKPKLEKLSCDINGNVKIKKGYGLHSISTKDDIENITERIKSIAEHGILASEWFGIRYSLNEVPYRASFCRAKEDCLVADCEIRSNMSFNSGYVKISENNDLIFFVDIANPLLTPLVGGQNSLHLNRALKSRIHIDDAEYWTRSANTSAEGVWYDEKSFRDQIKMIMLGNDVAKNLVVTKESYKEVVTLLTGEDLYAGVKEGKYTVEQAIEILSKVIFDNDEIEKYISERTRRLKDLRYKNEYEKQRQASISYKENYYFVYAGVPSEFVTGIRVPQRLMKYEQILPLLSEGFSQAVIFDSEGNVLAGKENLVNNEEEAE